MIKGLENPQDLFSPRIVEVNSVSFLRQFHFSKFFVGPPKNPLTSQQQNHKGGVIGGSTFQITEQTFGLGP